MYISISSILTRITSYNVCYTKLLRAVADPNAGSLTFNPANSAFETTFSIRYRYTDGNGCIVEDIGTTIVHDLAGGAISISSAVPAKPCQDDNTDYVLQGLSVITSYSIHYTKLYDPKLA